jgi:endonuclease/exonuclease/phosphatase (EEP) superfamily protein YafD
MAVNLLRGAVSLIAMRRRSKGWHPVGPGLVALGLIIGLSTCSRAARNYDDGPAPRFVAEASAPPVRADTALQVVTWNVKWGRKPEAAEVLAVHPRLRDADLVVLQGMTERSVAIIAARLGAGYVYYPATLHPRVGHHVGNAIVSRWPLTEDRRLPLPRVARWLRTRRAAVVATALIRGQRVRVYALHLATPFEVGQGGVKDRLWAVIRDAAVAGDPVVIAGDLNSTTVGGLLVAAGYRWITQRVGPTAWKLPIDHVFARGLPAGAGSAGAVAEDDLPSEHRPVWAVIPLSAP